ncbi:MAG TPA: radical SAM protein [Methanospirillum sp.]|nr:radical SAM protein [Methanospirillum sp.]
MTRVSRSKLVKPWWSPPSLLARQAGSLIATGLLCGWRKMPVWMVRHALSCIPGAAGSWGMGCIGFPAHPVIELTGKCNLSCIHCHAGAGSGDGPELSTIEIFTVLDQLATVPEFRMVAFTGGEPLLRQDIFEILEYARDLGFSTTIATNGTLITPDIARRLADAGVAIVAISLDATDTETHDRIRGLPGARDLALKGIKAVKEAGITLHINVTIASYNEDQVMDLIRETEKLGAAILIMYQLVPVGRGGAIADQSLGTDANKRLIRSIAAGQRSVAVVIEPVAGPQYWADLLYNAGIRSGLLLKVFEQIFHGCCAGRGFIYIKPDGEVLPCPFVPVSCGNVRDIPVDQIYHTSPIFQRLQNRDLLLGSCGECQYRNLCGGCRGRAYAGGQDICGEDPACFLRNEIDES